MYLPADLPAGLGKGLEKVLAVNIIDKNVLPWSPRFMTW
jgi:hypothetical protein